MLCSVKIFISWINQNICHCLKIIWVIVWNYSILVFARSKLIKINFTPQKLYGKSVVSVVWVNQGLSFLDCLREKKFHVQFNNIGNRFCATFWVHAHKIHGRREIIYFVRNAGLKHDAMIRLRFFYGALTVILYSSRSKYQNFLWP